MTNPAVEQLYDRKAIVDVIQRDCLGHPGSSGVLVGAQKVGKSCLLGHVWSLGSKRRETLFCQIDLFSLEATGFTDNSFLRLLLSELQDSVSRVIEESESSEATWQAGLAESVILASTQELAGLQQVLDLIQAVLDRKKPLTPSDTFGVFNGLRKINKRVMLIIDEFHRLLREPGSQIVSSRSYAVPAAKGKF